MDNFEKLLNNIEDSYDDFIVAVLNFVKDNNERKERVINYINNNPGCLTSDILDYITPELLDIENLDDDYVINSEKPFTGEFRENCLEWLNGQDRITCTISQKRFKNKLLKLAEEYPDEVIIKHMNDGVTILFSIPLKYLSIRRPRELSEEEKIKAAERLKKFRKK